MTKHPEHWIMFFVFIVGPLAFAAYYNFEMAFGILVGFICAASFWGVTRPH